jgi:DNA-binding transcriptional regulator YhcF (GntR family)
MKIALDPKSPVPLYHQVAETISYRIATGRLLPGERLPPVREAAVVLGVNMHTVRRAYAELAQKGLVEMRGARGTRVLGRARVGPRGVSRRKLDGFMERVLREARQQHGLTRHDLVHLLANWSPATSEAAGVVHVVECSQAQCSDHVQEIKSHWQVDARPWCLSKQGEPPPGPIVATYFHHNEVRRRWPHRLHEIRFVAIRPDPRLPARVRPRPAPGKRSGLTLCELDEPMARNIASDLSVLFPADRYRIKPRVVQRAGELLESPQSRTPVLFSPRVWGQLSSAERNDARAIKVTYVIEPEELEAVGEHFGWRRRNATGSVSNERMTGNKTRKRSTS